MPEPRASELTRLHPAALAMSLIENVRMWSVGAAAVIVGFPVGILPVIALAAALASAGAVADFLRFRYGIDDDVLLVEGGVLVRWRRVVPLERVQSVEILQRLRHRLFGVVELRVEAIGGSKAEARLLALAPPEAERLRRQILERSRIAEADDAPTAPALVELTPADLVVYGVTGGRVAVLAAILAQFQQLFPEDLADRFEDLVAGIPVRTLVVVVLIVTLAVLLVSAAISVVATVLVFWGFTLRRDGDRLVVTRGLLARRRYLVPLRRVQSVELRENLLRRVLGLASLTVKVAGQTGSSTEVERSGVVVPIGRRADVLDVAARALGATFGHDPLIPAPRGALARRLVGVGVAVSVAVGLTAFFAGAWAFAVALGYPMGAAYAVASWRALGHAVGTDHVVVRSGVLERRTVFVRIPNIQCIRVRIGPTQRPFGVASLELPPARGTAVARDLAIPAAHSRFARLAELLLGGRSPA